MTAVTIASKYAAMRRNRPALRIAIVSTIVPDGMQRLAAGAIDLDQLMQPGVGHLACQRPHGRDVTQGEWLGQERAGYSRTWQQA